jgi:hypothetical protein
MQSSERARSEKIVSVTSPAGVDAVYSIRVTQSSGAMAYRDGNFICLLTIATDHNGAYGKRQRHSANAEPSVRK